MLLDFCLIKIAISCLKKSYLFTEFVKFWLKKANSGNTIGKLPRLLHYLVANIFPIFLILLISELIKEHKTKMIILKRLFEHSSKISECCFTNLIRLYHLISTLFPHINVVVVFLPFVIFQMSQNMFLEN